MSPEGIIDTKLVEGFSGVGEALNPPQTLAENAFELVAIAPQEATEIVAERLPFVNAVLDIAAKSSSQDNTIIEGLIAVLRSAYTAFDGAFASAMPGTAFDNPIFTIPVTVAVVYFSAQALKAVNFRW